MFVFIIQYILSIHIPLPLDFKYVSLSLSTPPCLSFSLSLFLSPFSLSYLCQFP